MLLTHTTGEISAEKKWVSLLKRRFPQATGDECTSLIAFCRNLTRGKGVDYSTLPQELQDAVSPSPFVLHAVYNLSRKLFDHACSLCYRLKTRNLPAPATPADRGPPRWPGARCRHPAEQQIRQRDALLQGDQPQRRRVEQGEHFNDMRTHTISPSATARARSLFFVLSRAPNN